MATNIINETIRTFLKPLSRPVTRNRRTARWIAIAGLMAVFAGLAFSFSDPLAYAFADHPLFPDSSAGDHYVWQRITREIQIAATIALVFSATIFTYLYTAGDLFHLVRTSTSYNPSVGADARISYAPTSPEYERLLREMRESISRLKEQTTITDADKKAVIAELHPALATQINMLLETKFSEDSKSAITAKIALDAAHEVKDRLKHFNIDNARKAAAALAWGVGTAFAGLVILVSFVYLPPRPATDLPAAFFQISARMSMVVIVEVVAFFFLRQYRNTLLDQKYIHNEITNADFKMMALRVALQSSGEATKGKILQELAKTERNFALKKGEVAAFQGSHNLLPISAVTDLLGKLVPLAKGQQGHGEE